MKILNNRRGDRGGHNKCSMYIIKSKFVSGRSPAPAPPRRDPRTTLSVGRARAKSMVAGLGNTCFFTILLLDYFVNLQKKQEKLHSFFCIAGLDELTYNSIY